MGSDTYVGDDDQVDGQSFQSLNCRMVPDVIGDIQIHLPENDSRRGPRRVSTQRKVAVQVQDAGMGAVLGLPSNRLDVADPRHEKAALECLCCGFGHAKPESVASRWNLYRRRV